MVRYILSILRLIEQEVPIESQRNTAEWAALRYIHALKEPATLPTVSLKPGAQQQVHRVLQHGLCDLWQSTNKLNRAHPIRTDAALTLEYNSKHRLERVVNNGLFATVADPNRASHRANNGGENIA